MPAQLDMDYSTWVPEAEWAARHGWDWVSFIVSALRTNDLGAQGCFPGHTANLKSPNLKCDALYRRPGKEIEPTTRDNASSSAGASPNESPIDVRGSHEIQFAQRI
jgi:hypothetical protein